MNIRMVYPSGGRGNTYIGAGFAHSRRATMNVTVATWNTEVMAIQNGTEVVTGSTEITYYDTITVGAGGTATTKFKAIGAEGSEVSFVYKVKNDGTYEDSWTQAATAESAGQFSYEADTKTISFFATDPNKPVEGDTLVCAYKFKSADNAQTIEINSDGIPDVVMVEGKNDYYIFRYFEDIIFKKTNTKYKFLPGLSCEKLFPLIQHYLAWGKNFIIIFYIVINRIVINNNKTR